MCSFGCIYTTVGVGLQRHSLAQIKHTHALALKRGTYFAIYKHLKQASGVFEVLVNNKTNILFEFEAQAAAPLHG